jgi:hypothetical protein
MEPTRSRFDPGCGGTSWVETGEASRGSSSHRSSTCCLALGLQQVCVATIRRPGSMESSAAPGLNSPESDLAADAADDAEQADHGEDRYDDDDYEEPAEKSAPPITWSPRVGDRYPRSTRARSGETRQQPTASGARRQPVALRSRYRDLH